MRVGEKILAAAHSRCASAPRIELLPLGSDHQTPGRSADAEALDDLALIEVDHRNVARIAVGRVEALSVRREGQMPDPRPDQIGPQHLEGFGVDLGNPVRRAERDISARSVGGELDPDSLDQLARTPGTSKAILATGRRDSRIENRPLFPKLRRDPDQLVVGRDLRRREAGYRPEYCRSARDWPHRSRAACSWSPRCSRRSARPGSRPCLPARPRPPTEPTIRALGDVDHGDSIVVLVGDE